MLDKLASWSNTLDLLRSKNKEAGILGAVKNTAGVMKNTLSKIHPRNSPVLKASKNLLPAAAFTAPFAYFDTKSNLDKFKPENQAMMEFNPGQG